MITVTKVTTRLKLLRYAVMPHYSSSIYFNVWKWLSQVHKNYNLALWMFQACVVTISIANSETWAWNGVSSKKVPHEPRWHLLVFINQTTNNLNNSDQAHCHCHCHIRMHTHTNIKIHVPLFITGMPHTSPCCSLFADSQAASCNTAVRLGLCIPGASNVAALLIWLRMW